MLNHRTKLDLFEQGVNMITQPTSIESPEQPQIDPRLYETFDEDTFRDWAWTNEQQSAGAFAPYQGEHVVIRNQKIVGHGGDAVDLMDRVCKETGLPINFLVLRYIESPDDCLSR